MATPMGHDLAKDLLRCLTAYPGSPQRSLNHLSKLSYAYLNLPT